MASVPNGYLFLSRQLYNKSLVHSTGTVTKNQSFHHTPSPTGGPALKGLPSLQSSARHNDELTEIRRT